MKAMDAIRSIMGRLMMREVLEDDLNVISEMGVAGYVTRVVLLPMGPLVFEGEECASEEAAEAAAIRVCLETFESISQLARDGLKAQKIIPKKTFDTNLASGDWVELVEDTVQEPAAKRARTGAPLQVGRHEIPRPKAKSMPKPANTVWDAAGTEYSTVKSLLHTILSKMIGRSATKADLKYDVEQVQEGYQATITVLPLGGQVIAGYPSHVKKDAELSAADVTIQWLQASVGPIVVPPPSRPQKRQFSEMASQQLQGFPVIPKIAKADKKVVRSMSSTSIQVQEGLEFCLQWRDSRLESCSHEDIQDPTSIDYYFGQVCLVCQAIVSMKGWSSHANGKKHLERLLAGPMRLRSEVERPLPSPPSDLLGPENFYSHGSWSLQDDEGQYPAVLTLGEMDFSFSLALARLRPPGTPLVATSFLAEHDPNEPEVHPADDGERAAYRRVSLPGMNGALQKNINALNAVGTQVLHSVDATDLEGTLRTQGVEGGFHIVIFPFPRYSLSRAPNPNNSRLLRDFFISTLNGVLLEGGLIQLVMLSSQYEDWDVNGMAADVGMRLTSRVQLPQNFYQAREMSGKPWKPAGAELLTFEAGR